MFCFSKKDETVSIMYYERYLLLFHVVSIGTCYILKNTVQLVQLTNMHIAQTKILRFVSSSSNQGLSDDSSNH